MLDQATSEEKAHSVFSASGAHRWLNCPGSIALAEKAPPQPESKYAAEGTKAHACLEFLLKNRTSLKTALASAKRLYPDEMVKHAHSAAVYILDRLEAAGDGAELLCETKVDASRFTVTGTFGTLDAAIVDHFGRLTVIDFKYGAGHAVDPSGDDGRGNPQLVYYALGTSYQFDHNFSDVELVVIQPRAYHESGETVRSHVMSMEDLLSWHRIFREGVMETGDPKAPLKPGKWCKWCPAGLICPKLKTEALEQAKVVFKDDVGVLSVPEARMIQLPHLGTILDGCDRLEEWIAQVRAHATGLLERGREVPGYKLVAKKAMRKWKDEAAAAALAKRAFGASAFAEPKLLSPAKLEAHFKAKGLDTTGVKKWIDAQTVKESSGTTMARDSDKRPSAKGKRDASSVFSVVDVKPVMKTEKGKKRHV